MFDFTNKYIQRIIFLVTIIPSIGFKKKISFTLILNREWNMLSFKSILVEI